ncbi:MAG: GGDEF domain-containing protein [Calditrichaeota bacterium]|nr:MAG: GGDEF domain-containing protein [Calditrichota bacterium]
MPLLKNKNKATNDFHPLQRALHELFIYLKERPDFDREIIGLVEELVSLSELPLDEKSLINFEKQVREFLFKLEFHDQSSDGGREKILRRLVKSLIELHIQNDNMNPFQEELIQLCEKIEIAKATDEMEDVRTQALDIIMKANLWRSEYQEKYAKAVTGLALKLLGTLQTPDDEYGDFNAKVESLVVNLKKGCDLNELELTNDRLSMLVKDYSVITNHNRREKEELLRIIKTLIEVLQSYSSGSGVFITGLTTFVDEIHEAEEYKELSQLREKLLQAATVMKEKAVDANDEIRVLHERILRSQSRVLTLEDELQKTRSELADALIERDNDPLTKLPNRRAFEREIKTALDNFSRHKIPYCIVMVDIDHFKIVNDTFGHQIGDKILENTAIIVRQLLRKIDFFARIGGEEFAAILPNTTPGGSVKVMERIRQKLQSTKFTLKQNEIKITASFGISELMAGMEQEAWLCAADDALYKAKENGRNRIEVAQELTTEAGCSPG